MILYLVKKYQPRNGTVFETSTEAWSYSKRCSSSIRFGSESLRLMQPRKRRAEQVAAGARPPMLSKEMSSTTVFGANILKEGSNPDSVGPGWQASRTERASEEICQGTAL